jgi:hypothetical protein
MIIRVGILILVLTSFGMAQLHHLTFTGAHFNGGTAVEYANSGHFVGKLNTGGSLYAPISFPDSANGMQVTRLSYSAWDGSATGQITLFLVKVDRWTGNSTNVASNSTGIAAAVNSVQYLNLPKSQMGAKGIDNNRWAWYLRVYFSEGDTALYLYHVTIRYE